MRAATQVACVVDVLRRAHFHVDVASVEPSTSVTLARGLRVTADALIGDVSAQVYDCVALPGGMPGAERLRDSAALATLLRAQVAEGRWVAAICAAPAVVLAGPGLVPAHAQMTCHAAFADALGGARGDIARRVVVDAERKLITSRGPGSALEWAIELVTQLGGGALAAEVAKPMHMHGADVRSVLE